MKTFNFNGKDYNVYTLNAFGEEFKVICVPETYRTNDTLAVSVIDTTEEEEFGVLTVNLPGNPSRLASKTRAFCKTYSENQEWAEDLLKQLGAVNTGIKAENGFVSCPLYDFTNAKF